MGPLSLRVTMRIRIYHCARRPWLPTSTLSLSLLLRVFCVHSARSANISPSRGLRDPDRRCHSLPCTFQTEYRSPNSVPNSAFREFGRIRRRKRPRRNSIPGTLGQGCETVRVTHLYYRCTLPATVTLYYYIRGQRHTHVRKQRVASTLRVTAS